MAGRCLFVDMNSFFASVEQQERAELRGRPVIVAPVDTDSTCAIAASYEAKRFGVRTLTNVGEAKRLCPGLQVVSARPHLYQQYHRRIVDALNAQFVGVKVLSVDEMACPLSRFHAGREAEERAARRVKEELYRTLGKVMRCSVGVAPNVFLAKVASNMQKPDGLTILDDSNLPQALFALKLRDLPGIGPAVHARLLRAGIYSVRDLLEASPAELRTAWGGICGERWWHMLRGSRDADYEANVCDDGRKSVGHSHVLPPEYRTLQGARGILMRLASRGLKRLRGYGLAARSVHLYVDFMRPPSPLKGESPASGEARRPSWGRSCSVGTATNDEIAWLKAVRRTLEPMAFPPGCAPLRVGVTFTDLADCRDVTPSLFDDAAKRARLAQTVDALNARFGHVVDLASVYWLREQAPYRIAFGASLLDGVEG